MERDNLFSFPFGNTAGGEEESEKDVRSNLHFGSPRTRQSSPAPAYPEYCGCSNNESPSCASYYGCGGCGCFGYGYEDHVKMFYVPYEASTLKFEGLSLKDKAVPEATNPFIFDPTNANLHKRNFLEKEKQRRDTVLRDLDDEVQRIRMFSQAKPGAVPRSHLTNSRYQELSYLVQSNMTSEKDASTYAKVNAYPSPEGRNPCQYSSSSPLSSLRSINSANDTRRPHDSNCIANYWSTSIGNENYSYDAYFFGGFDLPELKFKSVDDAKGRIYDLAKDKSGCHFLKSMLKVDSPENVDKIFVEIIDHIDELMTNPFGNIVVQQLLGVCNEEQRVGILYAITREPGELIRISRNAHGSRAIQKVIETLRTIELFHIVASSLMPGIVSLMKHTNGSHVVECCLDCFPSEHCKFIISAAILHCVELGSDSRGCCVLQNCLKRSEGGQKNKLIYEICHNSHFLSQDPYGNYLVQSMLNLGIPKATAAVVDQLKGSYKILATQVHGSNVVEKCLNLASEECRAKIVHEMIRSPFLLEIAQDKYGNYVIQTALKVCKGALLYELVEAIRRHISALRHNKYGNKVAELFFLIREVNYLPY